MMKRTALIIDDEEQIRRVIRHALAADFPRVLEAATGAGGVDLAAAEKPELVVLDLMLPDTSGLDVCVELRKWSTAAILVLSAKYADQEKVALLDAGADDFVTKPFSTIELQARVRALLRRTAMPGNGTATTIQCGEMHVDLVARAVSISGGRIHVTPTEWELLRVLITNAGRTMTHRQLFGAVWPAKSAGDAQQYLRVHVANLRRKIETSPIDPRYVLTEPGVGYRFATCD